MGLRVEVKPSFGEQSVRPATQPLSRRLAQFVDRLPHIHIPFSLPSIAEIKQIIGRGILTAGAIGTPFLGVTPQAYAEGQPGVKPAGPTVTFTPTPEPGGINIELGEDGTPKVYIPSQESTIVVVDDNPVEASGVRAGGEPPVQPDDNPELTGQGGGGPVSPDAGATESAIKNSPSYLRVVNNLRELMSSSPKHSSDNEFGLDPDEIAEYIAHPDKTIFNTFRIWSKPNGDPFVVIVTGPRPGNFQGLIRPENIENLIGGLNLLYSIDPAMFDTLEQYGLKAISGNDAALTISGASSGFDERTVYLNEINTPNPVSRIEAIDQMYTILVEMRHSYTQRQPNPPDLLDPNLGIDKALWVSQFIDAHSEAFTPGEIRVLKSASKLVITFYTAHPEMGRPAS